MPRTRAPGLSTGRTQDRARPRPAFPPTHGALPGFGAFEFRTASEGRGSEPKLDPAALDTRLPWTVALAPPGSGRPEPRVTTAYARVRGAGCGPRRSWVRGWRLPFARSPARGGHRYPSMTQSATDTWPSAVGQGRDQTPRRRPPGPSCPWPPRTLAADH